MPYQTALFLNNDDARTKVFLEENRGVRARRTPSHDGDVTPDDFSPGTFTLFLGAKCHCNEADAG